MGVQILRRQRVIWISPTQSAVQKSPTPWLIYCEELCVTYREVRESSEYHNNNESSELHELDESSDYYTHNDSSNNHERVVWILRWHLNFPNSMSRPKKNGLNESSKARNCCLQILQRQQGIWISRTQWVVHKNNQLNESSSVRSCCHEYHEDNESSESHKLNPPRITNWTSHVHTLSHIISHYHTLSHIISFVLSVTFSCFVFLPSPFSFVFVLSHAKWFLLVTLCCQMLLSNAHVYARAQAHAYAHAHAYTHANANAHARARAHTHTLSHVHTHTCTHIHRHTPMCTHKQTRKHTHALHTSTHTRKNTQTHMHAHVHTQTHTRRVEWRTARCRACSAHCKC